jgi:hypothetical protein
MADRTAKLIHKYLGSIAGERRFRHPPGDGPFRSLVLSLGGMMEREAREALKVWKSVLPGEVFSLLVRRLCLGLLRARVRCISLCQPIHSR